MWMAWKRHSDEDMLKLLGKIELKPTRGGDVSSAYRTAGISDARHYSRFQLLLHVCF